MRTLTRFWGWSIRLRRFPHRRTIGGLNGLSRRRADAGSAGVGSLRAESKLKPIEIIMACEAGRISIGEWS